MLPNYYGRKVTESVPFLMWNINWMPKYDYQKTLLIPGDKSSCNFQTAETGNMGLLRTAKNYDGRIEINTEHQHKFLF